MDAVNNLYFTSLPCHLVTHQFHIIFVGKGAEPMNKDMAQSKGDKDRATLHPLPYFTFSPNCDATFSIILFLMINLECKCKL